MAQEKNNIGPQVPTVEGYSYSSNANSIIFFFINNLSNCVCGFDAFEHNKHIPKHNLNEKDNIIKPKTKFKQLKTQQHLVAKLQTNFSPQKRTMQS